MRIKNKLDNYFNLEYEIRNYFKGNDWIDDDQIIDLRAYLWKFVDKDTIICYTYDEDMEDEDSGMSFHICDVVSRGGFTKVQDTFDYEKNIYVYILDNKKKIEK